MKTILALAATAALLSAPAQAASAPYDIGDIGGAIVLPVIIEGETAEPPTMEVRMQQLRVPAASFFVLHAGQSVFTRAYGEGIDTDTLFQAASLSKPVAAAGIVALALERGVSLDEDISPALTGLDLQRLNPSGLPITLRGLLSHTNGARVGGFAGYAAGLMLPSTAQVIMGEDPANSDMVVFDPDWAGEYHYSGGGYTVAQYWAEQVTGEPFPAIMRRLVLDPLGMERSHFAAAWVDGMPRENVARASIVKGVPVEGGWHAYPEHAAASLWTTPREYALFGAALIAGHRGDADAPLPPSVVRAMTTPVSAEYGLGIGVSETGGITVLSHSGSNMGFRSNFVAYPASGDLMVAMGASENAWPLLMDAFRTASLAYGWPGEVPGRYARHAAGEEELAVFAGTYRLEDGTGPVVTIAPSGADLHGSIVDGATFSLIPVGEALFVDPEDGQEISFETDDAGRMLLRAGRNTFVRDAL